MMTLFISCYAFDHVIIAYRVRVDVTTADERKKAIIDLKASLAESFDTQPEFIKTIIEI